MAAAAAHMGIVEAQMAIATQPRAARMDARRLHQRLQDQVHLAPAQPLEVTGDVVASSTAQSAILMDLTVAAVVHTATVETLQPIARRRRAARADAPIPL